MLGLEGYLVLVVFSLASLLTLFFIIRKPMMRMRLGKKHISFETYFIGALLGPVLIMLAGLLNLNQVANGLNGTKGISPLGIIVIFLSMVFMSIFLDITGFFEFCARLALRFSGNDGTRLFFSLYAVVSLLTIFTSNDIIILTFTPFIYYFAQDAGINPKPYLIAEFFAANTWSMALYIGNPTNILLASAFGLHFDRYLIWMVLPTLAAGIASAGVLYLLFSREIIKPLAIKDHADPKSAISDMPGAILGILVLFCCIAALAIAPYLGMDMWVICLCSAAALLLMLLIRDICESLLRKRLDHAQGRFHLKSAARRMPWSVIPFVLSLFITVEALRIYGVTHWVGSLFIDISGNMPMKYVFVYGISSALAANVFNNIPMTVAYVSIIRGLNGQNLLAAVLATTVGSNLGANLTPIGALAGIMWMSILRGKDVKISFGEFMRYGLIVTPICLIACLCVLCIEFAILS